MNQSDMSCEPETIRGWIQKTATLFEEAKLYFGHGTDNAWDEAVQLVLHVMKLPYNADSTVAELILNADQASLLKQLINERIQTRKPLPYITRCAWFMRHPFYVDERVLIPRSPLGEWIERGLTPWIKGSVNRILDIGTGSGCLAIACGLIFPDAHIDAVDIDRQVLEVASLNLRNYAMEHRIQLIQSDVFSALNDQSYDVILSNPPYVDASETNDWPLEYTHEPKQALISEDDGLNIALKILKQAQQFLNANGILLMEVGQNADILRSRYPHIPFTWLAQERGGDGVLLLEKEQLEDCVWDSSC